jgi:hypothetical protein
MAEGSEQSEVANTPLLHHFPEQDPTYLGVCSLKYDHQGAQLSLAVFMG